MSHRADEQPNHSITARAEDAAPPAVRGESAQLAELVSEYEILACLGRGGAAVVYRARDIALDREVAIKLLRADRIENPETLVRLIREARMIARLRHPNIIEIHAVRRLTDGSVALVMEYVPGRSLKDTIRAEGPLPVEQVERILQDIAAALAHAHRNGIVHRDVKPENILLNAHDGRAYLTDFGIAYSAERSTGLTLVGAIVGTPTYMSPEQIDGVGVDRRSDLYSLGLVGWEMLTGEQPWEGQNLYSVIYKQKHEQLPPADERRSDIPERILIAIERSLEKDRGLRWHSAEDLQAELITGPEAPRRRKRAKSGTEQTPPKAMPAFSSPVIETADTLHLPRTEVAETALPATFEPGSSDALDSSATLLDDSVDPVAEYQASVQRRTRRTLLASAAVAALIVSGLVVAVNSGGEPEERAPVIAGVTPGPAAANGSVDPAATGAAADAADSALVPVATETADLALGGLHTCMLRDGRVDCWGSNARGQSGAAAQLGRLRFASLSAGMYQTCGVTTGGAVYCWGDNDYGQLGAGSTGAQPIATRVAAPARFTTVRTGRSHSCGITAAGEIYCWGENTQGQLGDGTLESRATPVRVATDPRFGSLALGWEHTCALTRDGRLYCWGANEDGQLGDGTTSGRTLPAPSGTRTRYRAITAGSAHTCALTRTGEVHCWGANHYGQLGDGTEVTRPAPMQIASGRSYVGVTAGSVHSCALSRDGAAYCWGRNSYGQLGTGTMQDSSVPVAVAGGHRFVSLQAHAAHTCGKTTEGQVLCWGYNVDGQLGDGTRENRAVPTPVRRRS